MKKLDLPDGLGMRLSKPSDKPFLEKLFMETREHFFIAEQEKDYVHMVIEHQQELQSTGYGNQSPNAMDYIIDKQGTSIGKVTIDFGHNVAHIVDIALIKVAQGKGYGKAIIQALQYIAYKQRLSVGLCVEKQNLGAKKLYISLGFNTEEQTATHEFMYWYPEGSRIQID